MTTLNWVLAHGIVISLFISELLPFLPGKVNGILQGLLTILKNIKTPAAVTVLCLFVSSCALGKRIAVDAGSCAAPAVVKEVENLTPAVLGILTGGSPDWMAQLGALEAIGLPFVICTVESIVSTISHRMPMGIHPELDASLVEAALRGHDYLSSHGVK